MKTVAGDPGAVNRGAYDEGICEIRASGRGIVRFARPRGRRGYGLVATGRNATRRLYRDRFPYAVDVATLPRHA